MTQPISEGQKISQGINGRLISVIKSDTVSLAPYCKGFKATVVGTVSFVTLGGSTISLSVNAGDEITLWAIDRINSTGTTADGYTVEG